MSNDKKLGLNMTQFAVSNLNDTMEDRLDLPVEFQVMDKDYKAEGTLLTLQTQQSVLDSDAILPDDIDIEYASGPAGTPTRNDGEDLAEITSDVIAQSFKDYLFQQGYADVSVQVVMGPLANKRSAKILLFGLPQGTAEADELPRKFKIQCVAFSK